MARYEMLSDDNLEYYKDMIKAQTQTQHLGPFE